MARSSLLKLYQASLHKLQFNGRSYSTVGREREVRLEVLKVLWEERASLHTRLLPPSTHLSLGYCSQRWGGKERRATSITRFLLDY